MADVTALSRDATAVTSFDLGSHKVYSSLYIVNGIDYGVLSTDTLSTLDNHIDVANRNLFLKGNEMTKFQPVKSEQINNV